MLTFSFWAQLKCDIKVKHCNTIFSSLKVIFILLNNYIAYKKVFENPNFDKIILLQLNNHGKIK